VSKKLEVYESLRVVRRGSIKHSLPRPHCGNTAGVTAVEVGDITEVLLVKVDGSALRLVRHPVPAPTAQMRRPRVVKI
jgi:hypothetical protein